TKPLSIMFRMNVFAISKGAARTMGNQTSPNTRSPQEAVIGIKLGRFFGITVVLDWSLLVIAVLITSSMALGLLVEWHPLWTPALRWLIGFLAAVILFTSVLVHEFSHALMARRYG